MDKTKGGYIAGSVSIIINSILFIAKMWVSIMTGSIALAADAWHTLSDSLSSVIVPELRLSVAVTVNCC